MQQAALRQVVEVIMRTLPVDVARMVERLAVPRWADGDLQRRLAGEGPALGEAMEALRGFQFAELDSQGCLHYHDEVRQTLLARMQQERSEEYLAANRQAMAYFDGLAALAPLPERPVLQRESLYHLLILDEAAGLRLLNERLEEAACYRQLGAMDLLVETAAGQSERLSEDGQRWLRYFHACLDLVYCRKDWGEAAFAGLASGAADHLLQALATWKLGQVCSARQRWTESIRLCRNSLKRLQSAGERIYSARVMMSIGEAYCALAGESGAPAESLRERRGGIAGLVDFLQYLPFLAIRWLVRRFSFLPPLYFGMNYQEWIVAYLHRTAGHWFQKAAGLFAGQSDAVELTGARLALAGCEHEVGCWSRARRRYAALEQDIAVRQSPYRTAQIRLGQGKADLGEGRLQTAAALLEEATGVFRSFDDAASLGASAFLLGETRAQQGQPVEAAKAFLESVRAFQATGDTLALTRSLWRLEWLEEHHTLPEALRESIAAYQEAVPQRCSLGRFPQRLLLLFRRLALYLALPSAYVLTFLVAMVAAVFLSVLEAAILTIAGGSMLPLGVVLAVAGVLAGPVLLAAWIYRGVYYALGIAVVYILGRRLDPIEREQPVTLAVGETGVSRAMGPAGEAPAVETLEMAKITGCFSVDFKLWKRPILLVSRTLVATGARNLPVDGIVSGYEFLKRDIQRYLAGRPAPLKMQNHDFIFLVNRWVLITMMAVLAFTSYYASLEQKLKINAGFPAFSDKKQLLLSGVILLTIPTLMLILPPVTMWRLLAHRLRLEKAIGPQPVVVPTWLLLTLAILSTLLAVVWVLLIVLVH